MRLGYRYSYLKIAIIKNRNKFIAAEKNLYWTLNKAIDFGLLRGNMKNGKWTGTQQDAVQGAANADRGGLQL
jgi:hypothetical protein